MTPNVRIAKRRPEASNFGEKGEFTAESDLLVGMLQALVDFIEYLKTTAKEEAL
jgi:hypothetical protein